MGRNYRTPKKRKKKKKKSLCCQRSVKSLLGKIGQLWKKIPMQSSLSDAGGWEGAGVVDYGRMGRNRKGQELERRFLS